MPRLTIKNPKTGQAVIIKEDGTAVDSEGKPINLHDTKEVIEWLKNKEKSPEK